LVRVTALPPSFSVAEPFPVAEPRREQSPPFEQLYRQHRARLFGLAWCLTASAAEAEDAVQETFLRALRAPSPEVDAERARSWLNRILVNIVRDRRRRHVVSQRCVREVAARYGVSVDSAADPERSSAAGETLAAVLAAIDDLPQPLRTVLLLRRIEDRPTLEVARLLDVPEATVRTRLKRACDRVAESARTRLARRSDAAAD
jgi:RNA polymerase sigma-70 factor (ECF subfamily)